jgi:hypothetical protein
MDRYEHTLLEKLDTEVVIAALGYPVRMVGQVEVECCISAGRVRRVVALDGIEFDGNGMRVQIKGRFELTDLVDLDRLTAQVQGEKE